MSKLLARIIAYLILPKAKNATLATLIAPLVFLELCYRFIATSTIKYEASK